MTLPIQEDVSLQPFNTMAVPAQARYLIEIDSSRTAQHAIRFAKQNQLAMCVLGEGSNTLFTNDYPGLILLNRLRGLQVLEDSDQCVLVKVGAGENWHSFVAHSIQQEWKGLENLALIPGLVGAAPIQNIGAYGVEVQDFIVEVEFLDFETRDLKSIANLECQFAYRDSVFKQALLNKGLITSVTFRFNKQAKVNVSYPSLVDRLAGLNQPTAKNVFDAVIAIRTEKLPSPAKIPNLGSFFKNPIVDANKHQELKKQYPNLISYPHQNGFKLAAGWLIEEAGWKKKTIDQISVHKQQALVIVNPHKVTGAQVYKFAMALRSNIHQQFGITLDIEPTII